MTDWATDINPGAAIESGQALTFKVTNNTDPALFSVPPAISPAGQLTYTTAPNAHGFAKITLELMDDGGGRVLGVAASRERYVGQREARAPHRLFAGLPGAMKQRSQIRHRNGPPQGDMAGRQNLASIVQSTFRRLSSSQDAKSRKTATQFPVWSLTNLF